MPSVFAIPSVAFFGRTFDEYMQMFAIDEAALHGKRVLDCPSGPDGFVAETFARGLDVIGCDPMFSLDPEAAHARAKSDIENTLAVAIGNADSPRFRDPDAFARTKYEALARFMTDYAAGRGTRYVAASLPTLPFADRQFDLVLASHFLFCYADVRDGGMMTNSPFDLDFHLRSITEVARVCACEMRFVPTHGMQQPPQRHPFLQPAIERLHALGFTTRLQPSAYDDGFMPLVDVLVATRI